MQLRSFSQLVTTQLAFAANGAVSLAAVAREVAEVLQTSERAVSVQVSPAVVTGRRRMKSGMSLDVVVAVTNPSQGADVDRRDAGAHAHMDEGAGYSAE